MSSLDEIAHAVLAWHRQHPLALRLGPEAVHSIGLVALPFVRAAEGSSPPPAPPWWRFWERPLGRFGGDRPAFSEDFIEGLRPQAVARFALRHGIETTPVQEDWPQRRVAVDSRLAEAAAGGWPYERWLATAAVEGPQGRQRVLVSLQGREPLAVMGRRHWDRKRLLAAALLPCALLALALMLRPAAPPPAVPPKAAGALEPAELPALANAPASAAASGPASVPDGAFAPSPALSASPASVALPPASDPPIDIRPRLGPLREGAASRPPLGAALGKPLASAPASRPATAEARPVPTPASAAASADPERPALRPVPPGATPLALVSPGFAQRAEAEQQLARMLDHVHKAVAPGSRLQGEVIETPQGFRAAVYPFASREEAALINATMVARGWKTRAVEF